MKTLFFVLCLFLSVEGALSQETGKLYTTLSDLLNETSSSTLNVIKEKRNKKQLFMSGGGDFKIYNGDKELEFISQQFPQVQMLLWHSESLEQQYNQLMQLHHVFSTK